MRTAYLVIVMDAVDAALLAAVTAADPAKDLLPGYSYGSFPIKFLQAAIKFLSARIRQWRRLQCATCFPIALNLRCFPGFLSHFLRSSA
jgi:hypothetical protein